MVVQSSDNGLVGAVVLKPLCQQNQTMGIWYRLEIQRNVGKYGGKRPELAEIGHKQFISRKSLAGNNIIFSLPFPEYKNTSFSCAGLQTEAKTGGTVVLADMFSFGKGGAMSGAGLFLIKQNKASPQQNTLPHLR